MYHTIVGNDALAQQYFHDAYVNGPLGQTIASSGFYYWGTRGALGVAAIAATAAGGIGIYEFATGSRFLVESSGIWNIVRGRIGSGGLFQIRPVGAKPVFRLDWHGWRGGPSVPHIDMNAWNVQHWPWWW